MHTQATQKTSVRVAYQGSTDTWSLFDAPDVLRRLSHSAAMLLQPLLPGTLNNFIILRHIPFNRSLTLLTLIYFLLGFLILPSGLWAADLTWIGCGVTKKAFMAEIAAAYKKKSGVDIQLSGGGATKGIRAASLGSNDMGGTCRHWLGGIHNKHPQEKNSRLIQVAWDALVAIVPPDNPVDNITLEQFKNIYDGKITSWSELGESDNRIVLVTRKGKHSGVGHMFRRLVFHDTHYEYRAKSILVESTGPLEKFVERNKWAMGLDGVSSARKSKVKIISLNGTKPTKEGIASGKYPLFRPLYIAVNTKSSPETMKVIDFILSNEGQAIVADQGTVNLEEGKILAELWKQKKASLGL